MTTMICYILASPVFQKIIWFQFVNDYNDLLLGSPDWMFIIEMRFNSSMTTMICYPVNGNVSVSAKSFNSSMTTMICYSVSATTSGTYDKSFNSSMTTMICYLMRKNRSALTKCFNSSMTTMICYQRFATPSKLNLEFQFVNDYNDLLLT